MCGIVGIIDLVDREILPDLIVKMRDVMLTRGPDGTGEFIEVPVAMAMRRLSIIDLENGWQPLTSQNGQVVAFQNGEIYNYQTLKEELEAHGFHFKTKSDTEVLAHGFVQWGIEGLLERIDGMYAIAILDRTTRKLHLARDRFGEKPLFYCHNSGRFAYSSNLISLAALPWVDNDIDPISLDRYLALHFVPGDRTILKGIKRVLPGERLCIPIDNPEPQRSRYYRIPINKQRRISDRQLAEQLEKAVVSRLVADVPVGVFLSGGLDSSVVAAIAAKHNPQIDTFSMGFSSKAHDESIYAKEVAEAIGSTHHHFIFDENSFIDFLPQVAAALDEPIGDQAMLPLYWLCKEAKQHVTVVLSGEGADEIFAGYSYYQSFCTQTRWKDQLKTWLKPVNSPVPVYNRLAHNPIPMTPSGFPLLADPATRERLMGKSYFDIDAWEEDMLSWLDTTNEPLRRASSTDMVTWLPDDLLVKYDRMAMAHSLEGRAPFLQPNLVEMALQLPQNQRMSFQDSKIMLRRVAKHWLPNSILQRKKQGFVLPMAQWLQQWFQVHGGPDGYFMNREFPSLEIKQISQMVENNVKQGLSQERLVCALILLIEWYQSFKDKGQLLKDNYMQSD